jgi:hypothetical protein
MATLGIVKNAISVEIGGNGIAKYATDVHMASRYLVMVVETATDDKKSVIWHQTNFNSCTTLLAPVPLSQDGIRRQIPGRNHGLQ